MFDAVQQALLRSGALLDAAEVHGLVCGILCFGTINPELEKTWLNHALGEMSQGDALAEESRNVLRALQEYTVDRLEQEELSFYPLVPGDNSALEQRISALGGWCEGFLLGLSMAGLQDVRQLEGIGPELINDFAAIARIDANAEEGNNSETDYMELLEYVRMGVLSLYAEQHNARMH